MALLQAAKLVCSLILRKATFNDLARDRKIINDHTWDYSHLLPTTHQADYQLTVHEEYDEGHQTPAIYAKVLAKPGTPASKFFTRSGAGGWLGGYHLGDTALRVAPDTQTATHLHPYLRGKGIGKALYTALYAHAASANRTKIVGGEHSLDAAKVHRKLAEEHGLDYDPSLEGGSYSYTIKEELPS